MLKRENVGQLYEMSNDIVYARVMKLLEAGNSNFKYDGDESIIYQSENEKEIESYLGVRLEGEELSSHVEWFNGGEYLEVYQHVQIGKDDCIKKLQENFSDYEDRIWNSGENYDDSYNEIEKIIKEQMYKVFLEIIKEGFEIINNGNFKWK